MSTHAEIRLKARVICEELASLMMEVTSSSGVDSDALSELVLAYGYAERMLASINIQGENGSNRNPREQAGTQQPRLKVFEAQPTLRAKPQPWSVTEAARAGLVSFGDLATPEETTTSRMRERATPAELLTGEGPLITRARDRRRNG